MNAQATYTLLVNEVARLSNGSIDANTFIDKYIFGQLPDSTMLGISKTKQGIRKPDLLVSLKVIAVAKHTEKILTLMHASDDMKEFDKLVSKSKENQKEPEKKEKTDFDKILGGIMKVPKKDDKATK
jgi:transcriptional regulator with PAS, ATPase and Fis domain